MNKKAEQLIVRRHSRIECDIQCRLHIDEDHTEQIVLSRSVTHADGSVAVRVVDCSQGGLGIESAVYLPHGSHVVVQIDPDNIDGLQKTTTFHLRVQRGEMIARSPRYYMGTSLLERGSTKEAIDQLLAVTSQSNEDHQDTQNPHDSDTQAAEPTSSQSMEGT